MTELLRQSVVYLPGSLSLGIIYDLFIVEFPPPPPPPPQNGYIVEFSPGNMTI